MQDDMAKSGRRTMRHDGEQRSSYIMRMVDRPATNPSEVALLWGLAWLIIASILGWYFRIVPTSMFGFIPSGYVSLMWHVVVNVIVWIVSSALPFAFAVLLNRKTPTLEFFGRMLFAHWPVIWLMVPGIISDKISYSLFMANLDSLDFALSIKVQPLYTSLMILLTVVVLLWYLYWSFVAFRKATQRRGILVFAIFIAVMFASQCITGVTLDAVYKSILG